MHTDSDPHAINPEHIQHPEVSFDKTDLSARGILLFFVVLFISGVAIYLVIWGLYRTFNEVSWTGESRPNPMAVSQPAPQSGVLQNAGSVNVGQFPSPRLQVDEVTDLRKLLWQENQVLEAKPWQGQDGAMHIPIEQAMSILAQRGLPSQPGSGQEFQQGPPMGQTDSGNIGLNESEKLGDGHTP